MGVKDTQARDRIKGSTAKGGPPPGQPIFKFKDVFIPQLVTLLPDNVPFAFNLPRSFLLTPHFHNNLALQLDVSRVKYDPPLPPRSVVWTAPQTIIDSELNVSILMNAEKDVLVLSGAIDIPQQNGQGIWNSSLEPLQGTWTSQPEPQKKGINLYDFLWTLMIAPQEPTATDPVKTVVLGFEINGDQFWQVSSFPDNWIVTQFDLENGGIAVALTDPDNDNYCLTGGTFSGDIGAMVCNGVWTSNGTAPCPPQDWLEQRRRGYGVNDRRRCEDEDAEPLDGGTWTGTGGS